MITGFSIKGFKSLHDFDFKINEGLNVLVGPNGSGKSNICQALGIFGACARNKVTEYILSLGGVGCILGSGNDCQNSEIEISFSGEVEKGYRFRFPQKVRTRPDHRTVRYEYTATILLKDSLEIPNEFLSIKARKRGGDYHTIINAKKWMKDGNPSIRLHVYDHNNLGPCVAFLQSKKQKSHLFDHIIGHPAESFLEFLSSMGILFSQVARDASSSKIFNIDPHYAKKSVDILESNEMIGDGRRLANALHSMQLNRPNILKRVVSFMTTVLPQLENIESIHPPDQQIRSFVAIDNNGAKYPAQSLSDGTVKLLGLLVGIHSQNMGTILIEEPENYIHPWATRQLVEYLRGQLIRRNCILTTHSETLLNAIQPKEIIICTNPNGKGTITSRVSKKPHIAQAISDSGFGCGYHYTAGSLGGIPGD